MNAKPWTPEEFDRALELHLAGWAMSDIARAVGRTESATRFKFIARGFSSRRLEDAPSSVVEELPSDRREDDEARAEAERIVVEREKRAALRRERDGAVRAVLEDRLVETFREAIDACELSTTIHAPAPVKQSANASSAVLLLSDHHFGKVVNPREIERSSGVYNPAVALARLALLETEVLHHLREGPPVDELVVLFLGDIMEGALDHQAEREESLLISKQFALATTALSQFLIHLASAVPHIRVFGVAGNHGRWPSQRRTPTVGRESNFDRLVYSAIELIIEATGLKTVTFDLRDCSRQLIDIKSLRVQIAHGDEIRGGEFCATGIKREVYSSVLRHGPSGNAPNLWVIGDKHQTVSLPVGGGEFVINGSLVGEDVFAQRFAPSPPSQTLFWVCPERCRKTLQADIRLDGASASDPLPFALSPELLELLNPYHTCR